MPAAALSTAAEPATVTADSTCSSPWLRPPATAIAAKNVCACAASAAISMLTQACLIAWCTPIGLPNCSRVLACSVADAAAAAANPGRYPAASTMARPQIHSSSAGNQCMGSADSTVAEDIRVPGSAATTD